MTALVEERDGGAKAVAYQVTEETRFAIVMYGGVSLAIYMNGVAQELLHLVRATAPATPDSDVCLLRDVDVKGPERVYRKLGQLLGGDRGFASPPAPTDPVRTRFVVDVIAGTSAGGINGIYLSKALANGQIAPGFEHLQRLWKNEGDIAQLINDRKSVKDVAGLPVQSPPESFLNSSRMYRRLLEAFQAMDDADTRPPTDSPYVDELDLFVTTTDIRGLQRPIILADGAAWERRHRKVFHFRFLGAHAAIAADAHNDFKRANNPFLAFAARCTSAFPFAFEPMRLTDVATDALYAANYSDVPLSGCRGLFREYDADEYQSRAFGDGGYLDNAPFSYPTEMLSRRTAVVPVTRKLLYIEPDPELRKLEAANLRMDKPDVAQNVYACLLGLPRYETIREDIERVIERNRIIDRVNTTLCGIEEDVWAAYAGRGRPQSGRGEEWARQDLADSVALRGPGYGAYHRLKVATVTNDLAELVAFVADLDVDSDFFSAVRSLVAAWRRRHYVRYRAAASVSLPTENEFLLKFDFGYRFRRVNFLQAKIADVLPLEPAVSMGVETTQQRTRAHDLLRFAGIDGWQPTPGECAEFRAELRRIFRALNDIFIQLRDAARAVRHHDPLAKAVNDLQQLADLSTELRNLLALPTDEEREVSAREFIDRHDDAVQSMADAIDNGYHAAFVDGARRIEALVRSDVLDLKDPRSVARHYVWHYHRFFDEFDMVLFPTLYGTDVGEADPVEVYRVSPVDARALIDEGEVGCRKLAGTTLGHFGAFLDPLWRENDLLWGRLDGAERIIMAVWPADALASGGRQLRDALISEAQAAIVAELIVSHGREEAYRVLAEGFMRPKSPGPITSDALLGFVTRLKKFAAPDDRRILDHIDGATLVDRYRAAFTDDRRPQPKPTLESAGRGTAVVGRMLDALADRYGVRRRSLAGAIVFLGLSLWGLVEVAVPQTLTNLIVRHWLRVFLLVGIVITILGIFVAGNPAAQWHAPMWLWGIIVTSIALLMSAAVRWIGRKITRARTVPKV